MTNLVSHLKKLAFKFSGVEPYQLVVTSNQDTGLRQHPAQAIQASQWLYAPKPSLEPLLITFAMNSWVQVAVKKLAEKAATARLQISKRDDPTDLLDDHPLLDLLGEFGIPNDYQDRFEFFELHYQYLDLTGNSFWWLKPGNDGLPAEIHILDPSNMLIEPGTTKTVSHYIYRFGGIDLKLNPSEVIHFKRPNVYNRYWGLSPLYSIMTAIRTDQGMRNWNNQFFGDDNWSPSGMLVVPETMPDAEIKRLELELQAKHSGTRKTMIVRAREGQAVWLDAGLKPHEMDFVNGRLLTRQEVYEVLDLPLGIMSEASTEAHAIVSERQFAASATHRLNRTSSRIQTNLLGYWRNSNLLRIKFEDLTRQSVDWRREKDKYNVLAQFMSIDEIRATELNLKPLEGDTANASNRKVQTAKSVGTSQNGNVRHSSTSGGDRSDSTRQRDPDTGER